MSPEQSILNIPGIIQEQHWERRRERIYSWAGIIFTLVMSFLVTWEMFPVMIQHTINRAWELAITQGIVMSIASFLIYGGLVYQFTRLGYVHRRHRHCPVAKETLDQIYFGAAPTLTILVPSYREERRVIMQTLMSAALQTYPNRRLMLLIDDPPHTSSTENKQLLADARELPQHVATLLARPAQRMQQALDAFLVRLQQDMSDPLAELGLLSNLWSEVAAWHQKQINEYKVVDHVDRLYLHSVFEPHKELAQQRAEELSDLQVEGAKLIEADLLKEYRKLATLFAVEINSFERKQYVNLSHEPNKAMNLNSYIGLCGKQFHERVNAEGILLEEAAGEAEVGLQFPASDYFITLDADSLLLPEYAVRLVHLMEQPENNRIAVAQTPYSAIPDAPEMMERVAGATTDMQYIIHQGFTRYHATYWVGANALLRNTALQDIAVMSHERGYPVTRFIQDRTVIEDTESSVDLASYGWTLHNYPERLAYSATPPDFGSLIIQRRRWANGGLIIFPKLMRYLLSGPNRFRKISEGFFRIHYLVSIAAVNIGLLLLLATPLAESVSSIWLPLTALPYFLLYGRDLMLAGYRSSDLLRVYALNLLLIPVNLGGVIKSLQQAITGKQIPFGRTPKTSGRTAASPLYILVIYLLFTQWLFGAFMDFYSGFWVHGTFAGINAVFLLYALSVFVGFKQSWQDLRVRENPAKVSEVQLSASTDTAELLFSQPFNKNNELFDHEPQLNKK